MPSLYTQEYMARQRAEYERIRDTYPDLVAGVGFQCDAGWFPIIERYLVKVRALLDAHPGSTYELRQVREKMGGLRLYAGASEAIHEAVFAAYRAAEREADHTCEICGEPGRLVQIDRLYATRCQAHDEGGKEIQWQQPTEIAPGIRVHIPQEEP